MATYTCSLAASGVQPKAVHAGVNVVQGVYTSALNTSLSASGSAVILLCKIPAGCTVVEFVEHHTDKGAATQNINFGVRHGNSASSTFQAILSAGARATANRGGLNLPYTTANEASANERFKYVVASLDAGSQTSSHSIAFAVFFTVEGVE